MRFCEPILKDWQKRIDYWHNGVPLGGPRRAGKMEIENISMPLRGWIEGERGPRPRTLECAKHWSTHFSDRGNRHCL